MKFFDLKDYYMTNFSLISSGKWSLSDLDEMMFWEREIYVNLLIEHNKKINNQLQTNEMSWMNG